MSVSMKILACNFLLFKNVFVRFGVIVIANIIK